MPDRSRPSSYPHRVLRWILLLHLAAATGATAQTASVFNDLQGAWVGEGALMGRDAAFTMQWDVRAGLATLHFTNAFAGPDGSRTPVLSSAAVYRTSADTPEGVWFDSRGVRVAITWTATDSTLVSSWTAPTESGRTTYRLVGPDRVEVIDEVRRDGELRGFGTARYGRKPSTR